MFVRWTFRFSFWLVNQIKQNQLNTLTAMRQRSVVRNCFNFAFFERTNRNWASVIEVSSNKRNCSEKRPDYVELEVSKLRRLYFVFLIAKYEPQWSVIMCVCVCVCFVCVWVCVFGLYVWFYVCECVWCVWVQVWLVGHLQDLRIFLKALLNKLGVFDYFYENKTLPHCRAIDMDLTAIQETYFTARWDKCSLVRPARKKLKN